MPVKQIREEVDVLDLDRTFKASAQWVGLIAQTSGLWEWYGKLENPFPPKVEFMIGKRYILRRRNGKEGEISIRGKDSSPYGVTFDFWGEGAPPGTD
jgi:hypothetical protein